MRRLLVATATAALLIASTTTTLADPAGPGADVDPVDPGIGADGFDTDAYAAMREAAVSLVLTQDPRFEGVPDFERQAALANSNFDRTMLLASDYYRVLPTLATQFSPWMYDLGYVANWLVEVTLVEGCVGNTDGAGPPDGTAPWPDPCEWRHSWYYQVQPDGAVKLLFEEGHPDPGP